MEFIAILFSLVYSSISVFLLCRFRRSSSSPELEQRMRCERGEFVREEGEIETEMKGSLELCHGNSEMFAGSVDCSANCFVVMSKLSAVALKIFGSGVPSPAGRSEWGG